MRRLGLLLGLSALCALPARAEGPGILLGERLVFHPGIAVGAGYDSNVYYGDAPRAGQKDARVAQPYFYFRPLLDLATLSPQRGGLTPHTIDFRLHAALPVRFLLPGALTNYSIDAEGGLALTIFPFGNYTFDLFDNFTRVSQTPYNGEPENINSDRNQLGLKLRLKPGGQRLEIGLQYTFGLYFFEAPPPMSQNDFTAKNSFSNDFQLRVSWKFFPKTALYLNAGDTVTSYVNQNVNTPPTMYPFRVVLGVIGLITPTLSVNVNAGYGNPFSQAKTGYAQDYTSKAVALVEGTWKPTLVTGLTLGYKRDFLQALIGTYLDVDSAYLSLSQLIWRVTALVRFSYDHRAFQGNAANDRQPNGRVDHLIGAHVQLDLAIRDWFAISLGDDINYNKSNCDMGSNIEPCNYFRNDVWLRLAVAY